MNKSLKQITFCVLLGLLVGVNSQQPTALLELCRHGSRAPLNNTYDPTWSDSDQGELTPVGMRQHYILGTILKSQYPTIFNTADTPEIFMLADNFTRCIQSAVSQSAGLYANEGPGLGNSFPAAIAIPPYDLVQAEKIALTLSDSAAIPGNYFPAPVYTINDENVWIFDTMAFCPEYTLLSVQQLEDSASAAVWEMAQPTIEYINSLGGTPVNDLSDFLTFVDTVQSNVPVNKPLPNGIPLNNVQALTNITYLGSWYFQHSLYGSQELIALGVAPTFQQMFALIEAVVTGNGASTFSLLSGHDTNVQGVMAALGFINDSCILANYQAALNLQSLPYPLCYYPTFASTIKVEIYNTSTPYLKLKYNDVVVPVCGPSGTCTVTEFISIATNAVGGYTTSQVIQTCTQQSAEKAKKNIETFSVKDNNNSFTIQNILIAILSLSTIFLLVKNIQDKKKIAMSVKEKEELNELKTRMLNPCL